MITELLLKHVPKGTALVATTGFSPPDRAEPHRRPPARLRTVDLDACEPSERPAPPKSGTVVVQARTFTDLRRAVSLGSMLPEARRLLVIVEETQGIHLPTLSQRTEIRQIRFDRSDGWSWALDVRFRKATAPRRVLAEAAGTHRHGPAHMAPRVALVGRGAAHWRPGDPGAVTSPWQHQRDEDDRFSPADLVIHTEPADPATWPDPRARLVEQLDCDRLTWSELGRSEAGHDARGLVSEVSCVEAVPPIDEATVNPIGFADRHTASAAELAQTDGRWTVRSAAEDFEPVVLPHSGAVGDADIAKLRSLRSITIRWGHHSGPLAAVRAAASLAAAGVPLASPPPPLWAGALGPELTRVLVAGADIDLDDPVAREEHSIRLRRAALRTHSTAARWAHLSEKAGFPGPRRPTVSVLLCTRRPEFIPFALAQIARQRHVDLEVILTLHGIAADLPEPKRAIAEFPRPLTVVDVPSTEVFGAALNLGAQAASGDFLAKWDDDDWYGPEFLSDLLLARSYTGADLIGCGDQYIYLQPLDVTLFRRIATERYAGHVTGGSMLIDRDLFNEVGGFAPLPWGEDRSLLIAVDAAGGRTYRAHSLGYLVHRRESGHTWNPSVAHFLDRATNQRHGFAPSALLEFDDLETELVALNGGSPFEAVWPRGSSAAGGRSPGE
ncbi:glycosyltransferase [Glycomyces salinus]|uniref:glycosyltransferase n=1 Tax=Glycomyces salinus TaxID=980294 RepID=UPI0018EC4913|nr:glycosyltransferase family 2 protein [Glycomyces salinus]